MIWEGRGRTWWVAVMLVVVVALVGAACSGGDDEAAAPASGAGLSSDGPSSVVDAADGDQAVSEEQPASSGDAGTSSVDAPAASDDAADEGVTAEALPSRPVTLTTIDGVELAADVVVAGETWVLLGHQFGLDRSTWGALPSALQGLGYSTLAWDFRDHGESPEGDVGLIDLDWAAAVAFAEANGADRLLGVGASMGGTSGVVAVADGAPLERFVAISSGVNFTGQHAEEALERIAAAGGAPPMLFVSGDADVGAAFGLAEFDRITSRLGLAHETELYATSLHGNRLVESEAFGPAVVERVVGFLSEGAPSVSARTRYALAYVRFSGDSLEVVAQDPFGDGGPSAVIDLGIEPIFQGIPLWHPDGEQVGVTFFDGLFVWRPASGAIETPEIGRPVGFVASFFEAAWSPDGSRILFSVSTFDIAQAPSTPALFDVTGGAVVAPYSDELSPVVIGTPVWAPDGTRLIAEGPGSVVVLDGRTLAVIGSIELPRKPSPPSLRQVDALSWLPDSRGFVAVVEGGEVWRGDAMSGETELVMLLPGEVNSVRGTPLSPDGERLAWVDLSMVGDSYPLMVTSLGTGETETVVAAVSGEDYADVRWSPDGRYLSVTVHPGEVGTVDTVVVVEVATGERTVVGPGSSAEWRP
jgi:pimeloyl-ACP methyl ester carboxylesterase